MGDHVRGRRLSTVETAGFIAPQCNNRGGKAVNPCRRSKHEFMRHPNSSYDRRLHHGIQQPYPKWAP
jgi:hypothetical protein